MAREITEAYRVRAYDKVYDADTSVLVARCFTRSLDSKLFRVSPAGQPGASVRVKDGEPRCQRCDGGGCVHVKAVAAVLNGEAEEVL